MATAPDLPTAASESFDNLHTLWLANTLKVKLTAFCNGLLTQFDQQELASHPVSNWLVLINALASQMPSSSVSYSDLSTAADFVYRICWMTQQLGVTQSLISSSQAAAVLAAYNADF
jgi:hypothetical protein